MVGSSHPEYTKSNSANAQFFILEIFMYTHCSYVKLSTITPCLRHAKEGTSEKASMQNKGQTETI